MPESMFTLFIFPFQQLYRCILVDRTEQIPCFAVYTRRQHLLGQARADTFGYLHGRRTFSILSHGVIRKCNLNHTNLCNKLFCSIYYNMYSLSFRRPSINGHKFSTFIDFPKIIACFLQFSARFYRLIRLMMLYALTIPNSPALLKSAIPRFRSPIDKRAKPRLK